jgi:hypothetical protein
MTAFYNKGPYGIAHYSAGTETDLAGQLLIVVNMSSAILNGDFVLAGSLPINVYIGPIIPYVGPLWDTDTLCPDPDWATDALCPDPVWMSDSACSDPGWKASEKCSG